MPGIFPRHDVRDAVPAFQYAEDTQSVTSSPSAVWLIVGVVSGIIIVGAMLVFIALYYIKRCQYQRARQLEPYLTRDEFMRRRKLSAADLFREEEERRQYMIRKSLASRSTSSVGSRLAAMADQIDRELLEMERRESRRLKEDWKAWEARERQARSTSGVQHPAVASPPNDVPILPIPSPAKHRSQGRMQLMNPSRGPPTPPPRHPGRQAPG